MSGHSKWATIKRKKGEIDAKRGRVFTKLSREITTAARLGGGDVAGNPRLRLAMVVARGQRMPADTIERAVKKGIGALEGPPVEEITYEGYGPGGVAVLVQAQTDNRNRTSAELRAAFTKGGGSLGTSGTVAWLFRKRGRIAAPVAELGEDAAMEVGLAAGALEVQRVGDEMVLECEPQAFGPLLDALEAAGVGASSAAIEQVADLHVTLSPAQRGEVARLVERLEDLDDVQEVHVNAALHDEVPADPCPP